MKLAAKNKNQGFTLIELMVSMVITVILLSILFNVTALSSSSFTRAKGKLKMARVADQVFDQFELDIASAVIRGTDKHWFYAGAPIEPTKLFGDAPDAPASLADFDFLNTPSLIFYTAATDKYGGALTGDGDVSIVNYRMDFLDPLASLDGVGTSSEFKPLLFRYLFSPDDAFKGLTDAANDSPTTVDVGVKEIWEAVYRGSAIDPKPATVEGFNFTEVLGDGVYGITLGFELEYTREIKGDEPDDPSIFIKERQTVYVYPNAGKTDEPAVGHGIGKYLSVGKDGIESDALNVVALRSDPDVRGLEVKNMVVTLTLLDEVGMNYISRLVQGTADAGQFGSKAELIKEHGFTFTRVVPFY